MAEAEKEAKVAKLEKETADAAREAEKLRKDAEKRLAAEMKVKADMAAAKKEKERAISELRSGAKRMAEFLMAESTAPSSSQMQVVLAGLTGTDLQDVAMGMQSYGQALKNDTYFRNFLAAAN